MSGPNVSRRSANVLCTNEVATLAICAVLSAVHRVKKCVDRKGRIYYVSSMKIKTSITLSEDLVKEMDKLLGRSGNRSALVEQALRNYLTAKAQQIRDAKDLEILNRRAHKLNKEAQDVLSYQVEL